MDELVKAQLACELWLSVVVLLIWALAYTLSALVSWSLNDNR